VLLPATGDTPWPAITGLVFPAMGGILLVVGYLMFGRRVARDD
jgi:hypothetical protein